MIGLLTGTFDPVHIGHITLAKLALKQGNLSEVWLLVNPDPVHKRPMASWADRVAMARLAVKGEPEVRVPDLPPQLSRAAHTMANFNKLRSIFSSEQFVFVVGAEVLKDLPRWDDLESVVLSTAYLVAFRPQYGAIDLAAIRTRLGALGPSLDVKILETPTLPAVSSAAMRLALRTNGSPKGLPGVVTDYILAHNLYRG